MQRWSFWLTPFHVYLLKKKYRVLWSLSLLENYKGFFTLYKRIRVPTLMGVQLNFFLGLFDILGDDLLRVLEDSNQNMWILASFNTTFIALIPKNDAPHSFDDFRSISLCNGIYKMIMKIIKK